MTEKKQQTEVLCWEDGGRGQLTGGPPPTHGEPSPNAPGWPGELSFKHKRSEARSAVRGCRGVRSLQLAQRRGEDSPDPGSLAQGPGSPGVRVQGVLMGKS